MESGGLSTLLTGSFSDGKGLVVSAREHLYPDWQRGNLAANGRCNNGHRCHRLRSKVAWSLIRDVVHVFEKNGVLPILRSTLIDADGCRSRKPTRQRI